jgi:hypothetical protein
VRPWTWEGLAAATLGRQFPRIRGRDEAAVLDVVRRVGPIQSQAARAPFLSLAARLPGVSYDAVTATHASLRLVRSTSLRGTVHTSARDDHGALNAVSTRALAGLWRRTLKLSEPLLREFRAEIESLSEPGWVTHQEIETHMRDWFGRHGLRDSLAATDNEAGRFAYRAHAAMLRRPRAGAGWDSQAEVVYRAAGYAIGEATPDPQDALATLVRRQLAASGPATRRDLAWWSGDGLRNVDAAVASLGDEISSRPGPNGLDYLDLTSPPASVAADPGIRLLPEYDALLLGYDPPARDRFADAQAVSHTWNRANGVHSPTVLVDGRLRGRWRLERKAGSATILVEMFPGERLLDPGDLTEQAGAIATVLATPVTDVAVSRL